MTAAIWESFVRDSYGTHADGILAVYPHATDEEAAKATKDLLRDSVFAWPTWAWAMLQARLGTGKAYAYTSTIGHHDHQTAPIMPRRSGTSSRTWVPAEVLWVFKASAPGDC